MIHIIHISDSHKHFKEAISEYEKRLQKSIAIQTIKPIKHTDSNYIRTKETEKILEKLEKISGHIFLCDENGSHISTGNFAKCIQNLYNSSENIVFIIGGSYGFDTKKILQKHNAEIIKLSEMVLPH